MQYFDSQQDLDDYISAPDYLATDDTKGVCFGLQLFDPPENAPNNYTFSLHFPDKVIDKFSAIGYSAGIPNQQNPVYSPFASTPDLLSYFRYQHNGFEFLRNILATTAMQETTDMTAIPVPWIAFDFQPLQTDSSICLLYTSDAADE